MTTVYPTAKLKKAIYIPVVKVLRNIVSPQLVKEAELDQPARGWSERLFRVSLLVLVATGITISVLKLFFGREIIESSGGDGLVSLLLGITFLIFFFYVIHYMALMFCKSRIIRWAWLCVLNLVAIIFVLHYILPK